MGPRPSVAQPGGDPLALTCPSEVCWWALGTVKPVCPASQPGLGSRRPRPPWAAARAAKHFTQARCPGGPAQEGAPGPARRPAQRSGLTVSGRALGPEQAPQLVDSFLFLLGPAVQNLAERKDSESVGSGPKHVFSKGRWWEAGAGGSGTGSGGTLGLLGQGWWKPSGTLIRLSRAPLAEVHSPAFTPAPPNPFCSHPHTPLEGQPFSGPTALGIQ